MIAATRMHTGQLLGRRRRIRTRSRAAVPSIYRFDWKRAAVALASSGILSQGYLRSRLFLQCTADGFLDCDARNGRRCGSGRRNGQPLRSPTTLAWPLHAGSGPWADSDGPGLGVPHWGVRHLPRQLAGQSYRLQRHLDGGPRHMIYVTQLHVVRVKQTTAKRESHVNSVQSSHGRVLFESRNVQRNLIPRGRLGPLPSVSKGTA